MELKYYFLSLALVYSSCSSWSFSWSISVTTTSNSLLILLSSMTHFFGKTNCKLEGTPLVEEYA